MNQESGSKKHYSLFMLHDSGEPTGFTLVELLVVMAILGVLVTLVAGAFRNAQLRGRDAQRKSDLNNLSKALELFYSDYAKYPADSGGLIGACSYDPVVGSGSSCGWGSSNPFTDGKTTYFRVLPKDPSSGQSYFYRIVPGSNNQKFQIFARLENSQDPNCLTGICTNPTVPVPSGACGGNCNFAVTSANTTPTE